MSTGGLQKDVVQYSEDHSIYSNNFGYSNLEKSYQIVTPMVP